MNSLQRSGFIGFAIVAALVLVIPPYFMESTVYEGQYDEAVSLFPTDTKSKNYRLTANIETTVHYAILFTQQKQYVVKNVTWPNGGRVAVNCPGSPFDAGDRKSCVVGDDHYTIELNHPEEYLSP